MTIDGRPEPAPRRLFTLMGRLMLVYAVMLAGAALVAASDARNDFSPASAASVLMAAGMFAISAMSLLRFARRAS